MNVNSASSLPALAWLVFSVLAIFGAKGTKWKFLNLLIIAAFMAAGIGIGFV